MSLPALRYIFASDLTDSARAVALELANCHNGQTGACFPTVGEITESCGASKSTVIRALKALTAAGVITSERREDDRRECRYTFPGLAEWLETLGKGGRGRWKIGVTMTPTAQKVGVTMTPNRCHHDTENGGIGVTMTPTFPPPNIQDNQESFNRERTPARVRAGGRSREVAGKMAAEKRAAEKRATLAAMEAERAERERQLNEPRNIITWTNPFETKTTKAKPLNGTHHASDAARNTFKP